MEVEKIFSVICAHMAKGLEIHNQISNAFGFLNLCGYQKCHEYHFYEENKNYKELQNYYLSQYHKLIPIETFEKPEIIPSNWFKHLSFDVDTSSKRKGVKDLMEKWIDWEKETKQELAIYYKDLYENNEICAASIILHFLEDVDNELMCAQKKYLELEALGYDIIFISEEQEKLYNKYTKKIKHIFKNKEE